MHKHIIKITLATLLNFSDLTYLSFFFFGHDLGFKLVFGFGPGSGLYFGFGRELFGPFTTLWKSVGLVIKRLLTAGSIPELPKRLCVLGKIFYVYLQLGSSRLFGVVESLTKDYLLTDPEKICSALVWLDRVDSA